MKIKLGAIGEENSLVVINKIILEYRTKYDYFPFIYRKENEICKFIEDNQDKVDVWLVFGQLDYQRIMAWGKLKNQYIVLPIVVLVFIRFYVKLFIKIIKSKK